MEKAILKTLNYSDIFDYPLKDYEIHKWLIGRKATLRQIEKSLGRLRVKGKAGRVKDYYFLPNRNALAQKRKLREKQSANFLFKAKFLTWFLKAIPWLKLVGISGGLSMGNAGKKDDIDLILITSEQRIWLTRLLVIMILDLLGARRKVKMKKVSGKICPNILLEEDRLEQKNKDIFVAHEVLQMKVLWQRDGVYKKYLEDNNWAFKFLPNWIGHSEQVASSKYYVLREKAKNIHNTYYIIHTTINFIEILAKKFQLKIMEKPQGTERILDGGLYFHPNDIRKEILAKYQQKISKA